MTGDTLDGIVRQAVGAFGTEVEGVVKTAVAHALLLQREEHAKLCEAMRPQGGRAWTEGQTATYDALSEAASNIRALPVPAV